MLTSLLVRLKRACPLLWRGVESVNSVLMRIRYPSLPLIAAREGAALTSRRHDGLTWSPVTPGDAGALSRFLTSMPAARMRHFNPHPFDPATLRRMASGRSFVMFKVTGRNGDIVGYHFLRCFWTGRTFHGLTVAPEAGGRGIGGDMWALGARIATSAGMDMRATISESNLPSLRSCRRATRCTVIERLPDGYLLVGCTPRDD